MKGLVSAILSLLLLDAVFGAFALGSVRWAEARGTHVHLLPTERNSPELPRCAAALPSLQQVF